MDGTIAGWQLQEDIDALNTHLEICRHDISKAPAMLALMKQKTALVRELVNAMRESTEVIARDEFKDYMLEVAKAIKKELPKDLAEKVIFAINELDQP